MYAQPCFYIQLSKLVGFLLSDRRKVDECGLSTAGKTNILDSFTTADRTTSSELPETLFINGDASECLLTPWICDDCMVLSGGYDTPEE